MDKIEGAGGAGGVFLLGESSLCRSLKCSVVVSRSRRGIVKRFSVDMPGSVSAQSDVVSCIMFAGYLVFADPLGGYFVDYTRHS